MSKQLFAKAVGSAGAVAEEETGESLSVAFSDSMKELDAFVKANADSSALMGKDKRGVASEDEDEDEDGEKPHDESGEEEDLTKAQERDLELTTHGQTKKKGTPHARTMHKSVDEGEVQEIDGEEVIAGFQRALGKVAKSVAAIASRMDVMQAENVSLTAMLAKAVMSEGALLKAVAGELSQIGQASRPRKSLLTVFEKSASGGVPAAASDKEAFDGAAFLAKAVAAAGAGRISPVQVGEVRQLLSANMPVPADLASRIEGK